MSQSGNPEDPCVRTATSESPEPPLRFGLGQMFIAITAAAALLALFRSIGIFGALLSFLASLAFTLFIVPQIFRDQRAVQEGWFDFVWGVLMPLVCLTFDPFLFKDTDDFPGLLGSQRNPLGLSRVHDASFVAYAALLLQMGGLSFCLVAGRISRGWSACWAGFLSVGACTAGFMGLALIPLSLVGLFFGVGMLGFTPLLTCFAYSRRMARQAASGQLWSPSWAPMGPRGMAILGMLTAMALPLALGLMALAAVRGSEHVVRLLE